MQLRLTVTRRWMCGGALSCLAALAAVTAASQANVQSKVAAPSASSPRSSIATLSRDPLLDEASDHFYNMDYDLAVQGFEKLMDRHPDDPAAINRVISSTLMRELYRIGAMNTGEYSNDSFIGQAHRAAGPASERAHQATGGARRGSRRAAAESRSQQCDGALRPRRYASAVLTLYRAGRAGLVLRAAECGGCASRSRTRSGLNTDCTAAKLVIDATIT